ncbi:MAG: hypothetical protein GY788_17650, partial [bacterium]|nr:hypothetical protein [bacterium]
MEDHTAQISRRHVVVGAAGLAAGAVAANTAQAQTTSLSDRPVDPDHLHAAGEASHDSQKACVPVLGLAVGQLADGNSKMVACVETTTNMLALTEALHTIAA